LKRPIKIKTRFESGSFEASGAALTASTLFGGPFAKGEPGAAAPGWLKLGRPFTGKQPATPFETSVSVDGVNQILFAIWGMGSLNRSVDVAGTAAKISAELPPLLLVTEDKSLRVAIGELVVEAKISGKTFGAATTIMQDVRPTIIGQNIALTPRGQPTVSITWLGDDPPPPDLAATVAAVAKEAMLKVVRPLRVPLPRAPLDGVGPALAGKTLALTSGKLVFDPVRSRMTAQGSLAIQR
jgi:hypothetical protein